MMSFEIRKGVPCPDPYKQGRQTLYPWKEMEVGDSFVVPLKPGRTASYHLNIMGALARCSSTRYGKVFRARRVGDEVAVWRIS